MCHSPPADGATCRGNGMGSDVTVCFTVKGACTCCCAWSLQFDHPCPSGLAEFVLPALCPLFFFTRYRNWCRGELNCQVKPDCVYNFISRWTLLIFQSYKLQVQVPWPWRWGCGMAGVQWGVHGWALWKRAVYICFRLLSSEGYGCPDGSCCWQPFWPC